MKEITETTQELIGSFATAPSLPTGKVLYRNLVEKISQLYVAYQKHKVVPKARKNLSLIAQLPEDDPQITGWINTISQNVIYSYIELFLDLIRGTDYLNKKIEIDHKALEKLREVLANGYGVVLAGTHTSGFDHAVFSLNYHLPGIQVLSKANPTGGNRLMYYLRKVHNILVTPISVSALREAIKRLRAAGVVAVAIDLPIPNGDYYKFFGQDCPLTDAHTRMAVKSGARIFLVYTRRTPSGRYQIKLQEVKPPKNCPNKKSLIATWAQKSYQQVEEFILQWPDAWYGTTFDLFSQDDAVNIQAPPLLQH
jgi:lauroyl/myristoyl acyltransferase